MNSIDQYLPHGFCIKWSPELLTANVLSDGLIFLSYFAIPPMLFHFAKKRGDTSLHGLLLLFAAFIFTCGTTHLMGIVTFWLPYYWLEAALKVVTAIISVMTVFYLWPRIPTILNLPSPDQLMALNNRLQQEINEREQVEIALRQSTALAEQAAQAKAQFLANMSHEIRTPMNAIIGLSRLALNKSAPDDVRDYLEKINGSSESLLGILNDILDFSKIETGKFEIDRTGFNLPDVIERLRSLFSVRAAEKGLDFNVRLSPHVPVQLIGDPLRLQQILANLLGNAIKFTSHGEVTLFIQMLSRDEHEVRIRFGVEDSGIGMSQADIGKLFQPFSQADSSITRRFGGTGLGLAISHKLLELMGSQFHVHSTPEQGSCFSFELALDIAPQTDVATSPEKRQAVGELASQMRQGGMSLKGIRILVAEDNAINQQIIQEFLQLSDADVVIANNGKEVLQCLQLQAVDAVLMDVQMPEMGGMEATVEIRKQAQFRDLPVIAFTAGATREEREQCMACGMNDFIAKPINPLELITTLRKWLRPATLPANTNPEMPPLQLLADLPGFDLGNLRMIFANDPVPIVKILCDFLDKNRSLQAEIEACLAVNDFARAERLVHDLKGSAGNIGANELAAAAQTLDAGLKRGTLNLDAYSEFKNSLEKCLTALGKLSLVESR